MGTFYPQYYNNYDYYNNHQNYYPNYTNNYYNNYDYSYNYYNYNYQQYQYDFETRQQLTPGEISIYEKTFAIQSILRKILCYSTTQELKLKRQVCKQWNEEAYHVLKEKAILKLQDYESINKFVAERSKNESCLQRFKFGPDICQDASRIEKFMVVFGANIKYLELPNSSLQIQWLKTILSHKLPNLTELSISSKIMNDCESPLPMLSTILPNLKSVNFFRSIEPNTDYSALKSLLKGIMKVSPNLTSIGVTGPPEFPPISDISDLTINKLKNDPPALDSQLWSAILEGKPNLNLCNINLNLKLTRQCVQTLKSKKFQLKSLDLKNVPNKVLRDLLTTLKQSLVNIKLQYSGETPEFESDLPIMHSMEKVRCVQLEGYKGSLSFLEKLPNITELILKNLNVIQVVLKDVDCPQKPERVHGSLKTLKVYHDTSSNGNSNRPRSIQAIQKLGMQFPSVKYLRLEKLVDENLCLIYAQWPNLEKLEIVHGQFSDTGTTAIHPNAYKVILREETYDNYNVDALRQGLFLGNLSRLTSLKIHSTNITDVTVILGILQCPNIRHISIQSNQVTNISLFKLLLNPSVMHITTKNCDKLSLEAIEYASKVMKLRGGTSSLNNKSKGSMNVNQVIRFLEKNPKPKVLLKRLSARQINITEKKVNSLEKINFKKSKTAEAESPSSSKIIDLKITKVQKKCADVKVKRSYLKKKKVVHVEVPVPVEGRPVRNTGSIFRRFKDFALY